MKNKHQCPFCKRGFVRATDKMAHVVLQHRNETKHIPRLERRGMIPTKGNCPQCGRGLLVEVQDVCICGYDKRKTTKAQDES